MSYGHIFCGSSKRPKPNDPSQALGIKETAEKLGIRAERVDEQMFHKENILERIYGQIDTADLIIADLTGRNPDVFYETGYAHAKGKLCLLLTGGQPLSAPTTLSQSSSFISSGNLVVELWWYSTLNGVCIFSGASGNRLPKHRSSVNPLLLRPG